MQETTSLSSSPPEADRLLPVTLKHLHPHPANANEMSDERLAKLQRNIEREGRYPPVIVRPHPDHAEAFEILDGHQRVEVLRRLGHEHALCFVWPCDDETALILLATLNRLAGEDVPARRADLLRELRALLPAEALTGLLPESASAIEETLALFALDSEALLAQLTAASVRASADAPRLISFAVLPDDEATVERAIEAASAELEGRNRRGRALALVCSAYLEVRDD